MSTATAILPRPHRVSGEFGIYVHVPFCAHRCFYCDFNAYAGLDDLAPAYMQALVRDAGEALSAPFAPDERPVVTSVFVGGGTPSLVDPRALVAVLDAIRGAWNVAPEAEITVECNPESVTAATLETYLRGGVTRVSFGIQTLDDDGLRWLGRLHDAATATAALATARSAGFDRVNGDLIFGVPGESDDGWRRSVEGLLAAGATHVSCYGLTYEEGTPLHAWRRLGRITPVDDDDAARRWELADEVLAAAGFERYEISNWSTPGQACRHNELYWAFGEYLGLGAGAHGHLADDEGSVRSWTVKAPQRYIADVGAGRRPVAGQERVDAGLRAAEVVFCGLRRTAGLSGRDFTTLTGMDLDGRWGPEIDGACEAGLLGRDGDRVALTPRGTLLANEVLSTFL